MTLAGVVGSGAVAGAAKQDEAWKAKLADGAHQFESMMLEQLMKPLKFGGVPGSGGGEEDDNGETADAGADIVRGFGTQALAKAISAGGGFGIAAQVIRQVSLEHTSETKRLDSTKVA